MTIRSRGQFRCNVRLPVTAWKRFSTQSPPLTILYIVSSQSDMEVVGEAGDGREALRIVQTLRPSIVLMDISMPGAV